MCAIDVAKESGKVCTRVPHETLWARLLDLALRGLGRLAG